MSAVNTEFLLLI